MSFFLLSWGKVILERMSFGLWIVSYFVTFKVQATAVKLQSVATPVLHESPMPAPATGSDGLTLCRTMCACDVSEPRAGVRAACSAPAGGVITPSTRRQVGLGPPAGADGPGA